MHKFALGQSPARVPEVKLPDRFWTEILDLDPDPFVDPPQCVIHWNFGFIAYHPPGDRAVGQLLQTVGLDRVALGDRRPRGYVRLPAQ